MNNEWNPISRNPKCDKEPGSLGVPVLVWIHEPAYRDGGYTRICYYGRCINDEVSFHEYGRAVRNVIYWMYLPTPPRF